MLIYFLIFLSSSFITLTIEEKNDEKEHHISETTMRGRLCNNTQLSACLCGEQAGLTPGTILTLSVHIAYLLNSQAPCIVSNLSSFKLVSNGGIARVRCSAVFPVVIIFRNVSLLEITNINFTNCGGVIPHRFLESTQVDIGQQAVIYISYSKSVVLKTVTVSHYQGFALFLADVHHAFVDKAGVSFTKCCTTETNISCSCSGIVVYYRAKKPNPSGINLTLQNSKFYNNYNSYNPKYIVSRSCEISNDSLLPVSASFTVIISQTNVNKIKIDNNQFLDNFGIGGGAISIIASFINNYEYKLPLSMENNYFRRNYFVSIRNVCIGSAIAIKLASFKNLNTNLKQLADEIPEVSIYMMNNTVTRHENNSTIAITSFGWLSVTINITDLHCYHNAPFYDGICLTAKMQQSLTKNQQLSIFEIYLNNIKAIQNSKWNMASTGTTSRSSVLMFINIPFIVISGTQSNPTYFQGNNVPAVVSIKSRVTLAGTIEFNEVSTSTALYLADSSYLILRQKSNILFTGKYDNVPNEPLIAATNDASNTEETLCALQLDIDRCDRQYVMDSYNIKLFNDSILQLVPAYNCIDMNAAVCDINMTDFYKHAFGSAIVRSNPIGAYYFKNDQQRGGYEEHDVYPGMSFTLCIALMDYVNNIIPGTISITLYKARHHTNYLHFGNNKTTIVEVSYNYTNCRNFTLCVYNSQNTVTESSLIVSEIGMQTTLVLDITVKQCPPGLMLVSAGKCECNQFMQELQIKKNIEVNCKIQQKSRLNQYSTRLLFQKYFWLGFSNKETASRAQTKKNWTNNSVLLYTSICPLGFCNYTRDYVDLTVKDDLCIGKRTGQVCSECKEGLSVVFGSTHCTQCSNKWLWTILVYMLLGIFLVIILLQLHLTIDHGAFTSLVLYSNIAMFGLSLVQGANPNLISYESIIVSFINFNTGYPLCLYNGMTETVKTAMQFLFPVYIWILTMIIIVVSKYSTSVSNYIASGSVQVLVTISHLSYAKVLVTVTNVITPLAALVENSETHKITVIHLWNSSPNVPYGSTWQHIVLIMVAAMFLMLFILPYLLLALCVPFCWRQRLVIQFRPVFETMYAPYKQKYAFWFGIRLLVLTVFAIVSAVSQGANVYIELMLFQTILILLIVTQAFVNPFKNKLVSIIDLYFLLNIAFMYILCTFQSLHNHFLDTKSMRILFLAMYSTIILLICGILIYHVIKYVRSVNAFSMSILQSFAKQKPFIRVFRTFQRREEYEPIEDNSNTTLREPLLQYSSQ